MSELSVYRCGIFLSACSFDFFIIDFQLQPKPPIANRAQARPTTIWNTRLMVSISVPLKCTARTKTIITVDRDFPFTLHRNSPAHLKSHNIKISLRLQQFSGRPSELSRKKRQKSRTLMSRSHLFLLFLHTATVALHSGVRFF